MPKQYKNNNDGKLYTRYSELVNCTPAGIEQVLNVRFGLEKPLDSPVFEFGRVRHELIAEEIDRHNALPLYMDGSNQAISETEVSRKAEIIPGVVLSFTPDAVDYKNKIIFDFKTALVTREGAVPNAEKLYKKSMQLKLYALMLGYAGKSITTGRYIVEAWNREHVGGDGIIVPQQSQIVGYSTYTFPIGIRDKGIARAWAVDRIKLLMAGIADYESRGYEQRA